MIKLNRLRKQYSFRLVIFLFFLVCFSIPLNAQESGYPFLDFIKKSAAQKHDHKHSPATLDAWNRQNKALRKQLLNSWGGFPEKDAPLEPQILGKLQRDGYHVEKILFQTLPDIWMTANAYVPDQKEKVPAVLCVHGHWPGAKQDPHVQARCVGLAKLGFFVLAVDAFGAGERAISKVLGEYHGEMVAATLFPIGKPLSGIQVYENSRAVDYLLTRKEVDGKHLGITGASGGGNQSMYAGAWDKRFSAVVPVCSVGNYQAYLQTACCMCEVVPAALQYTEEWGVLGLTAPRALMVINATQDGIQFSVPEAKKSLKLVKPIYKLHGCENHVRHTVFESRHDYNQPMREAMYGWMTLHLKGEGDGNPIAEPEMNLEPPESLRCFPAQTRPDSWITLPQYAYRLGELQNSKRPVPQTKNEWIQFAKNCKEALHNDVLGNTLPPKTVKYSSLTEPVKKASDAEKSDEDANLSEQETSSNAEIITFESEPGIELSMRRFAGTSPQCNKTILLLSLEQEKSLTFEEYKNRLLQSGAQVVIPTLRATGNLAWKRDQIRRAPDHNTAQWALWLGRPLLGQWVRDVRTVVSLLKSKNDSNNTITLIGIGPAGVVAICTAALDSRIQNIVTVNSLSSYVTNKPYENQRMGTIAPGIVRDAGDIPHLAALIAPRKLIISAGVNAQGEPLNASDLNQQFTYTTKAYELENANDNFTILPENSPEEIIKLLK